MHVIFLLIMRGTLLSVFGFSQLTTHTHTGDIVLRKHDLFLFFQGHLFCHLRLICNLQFAISYPISETFNVFRNKLAQ